MSEPKFTKGPWKWWTSNSIRRLTSHADGRSGQDGGVLHAYLSHADGCPDVAVSKADAHLIAAAPELYSALSELVYVTGPTEPVCTTFDDIKAIHDRARAALALARGEGKNG